MAFVSESAREFSSHIKQTASGQIGPGQYHNEGFLHKLAMESIYPRKKAPFNSNSNTGRFQSQAVIVDGSPCPGKYNHRSSFDLNKYIKTMDN